MVPKIGNIKIFRHANLSCVADIRAEKSLRWSSLVYRIKEYGPQKQRLRWQRQRQKKIRDVFSSDAKNDQLKLQTQ